jgi:5-methylcytosine-specific restriction endonuclease McrA
MKKDDSLSGLLKALLSPSKEDVWAKAHYCDPENERRGFRKDDFGNWIHRDQYGNRNHKYGWEFDHVHPSSLGGHDGLTNIRPLHWQANISKSDTPAGLLGLAQAFARKGGNI